MSSEQLLSYRLPLFDGITAAQLDGIDIECSEHKIRAGERVFDQDDNSNDLYFLLSGTLLAIYWTPEGREIVYYRFPKGIHFGELAALEGIPRTMAVVAKSPVKILMLKQASFMQLFNEVPKVRERVVSGLISKLRHLTIRNMELTTLSVEERTVRYLHRLAGDLGVLNTGGAIANAPTHSEIANSIGANREMVSRTMSKLSKQGVIKSSRQKIVILDADALIGFTT